MVVISINKESLICWVILIVAVVAFLALLFVDASHTRDALEHWKQTIQAAG